MSVSVRSLWVVFEPTALSVPPSPWVPPVVPMVCNSSLSGLGDIADDWCGYVDDAALLAAYNWVLYPPVGGGSAFWSDYNEPTEDYEGRVDGPWNVAVPMAPDWQHAHMERGLPFNGGSTAMVFDSDEIFVQTGNTAPEMYIYALSNQVPGGSTFPVDGSISKSTMVQRIFIDPASDLDAVDSYVNVGTVWFNSGPLAFGVPGSFSSAYAYVGRYSPYPDNVDAGSPHLFLQVWSYNTTPPHYLSIDCGNAADIINDAIGYEFFLSLEIIPSTSTSYDKVEAVLKAYPLPGATGTFAGTWVARIQNLMGWDHYPLSFYWFNNGKGSGGGRVRAGCYSYEGWTGNKIWIGSPQPPVTSTTDTTPTPNDNSAVTDSFSTTDPFDPRPPGRPGLPSPNVPLISPWVRFNDGGIISSVVKDGSGNVILALGADGSGIPRGMEAPCPQLVTDHFYQLTLTGAAASEANSGVFIWARESATGKWVAFGIHNNGTNRRMSVWKGTGLAITGTEIARGASNIAGTSGTIILERFSGQWYFEYNIGGFNTLTNVSLATLFTTGPDRIGFGQWSGASGQTVSLASLTFS